MNHHKFVLRLGLLALVTLQCSYAVDFTLSVTGSKSVMQGYSTVFAVSGKITSGVDEQAYVSIAGLPAGAEAVWWVIKTGCCSTFAWRITNDQLVQVLVPESAAPGPYPLTITYRSFSGVTRSVSFPLQVEAKPAAQPPPSVSPAADLAEAAQWRTNMTWYGDKHCVPSQTDVSSEGNAWDYDGSRVYAQIAAITGQSKYLTCSEMFNSAYRQYVTGANGNIGGWRYFPHGLTMHYQRTADELSRTAVFTMMDGSSWTHPATFNLLHINPAASREVGYAVQVLMAAERLGRSRSPKLLYLIDCLLSHFDQWYVHRSATPQPFMVGLAAEALIEYYELSGDARIPGVLRRAADGLWAGSWDPVSQSFLYEEFSNGTRVPAPDMNLLIVPLYGWVFRNTGDPIYRDRGDTVFAAGVKLAWLDGGKHFSHNYRWSPKYIEWRQPGNTTPTSTISATPSTVALTAGTSGNATISVTPQITAASPDITQTSDITLTVNPYVAPTGTAAFVKAESTTQGSWRGVYGADGYNVIANAASYPSYVSVTAWGHAQHLWTNSTAELRATQKAAPATDRLAACWYSGGTFRLHLSFNDQTVRQVAVYMVDWDGWDGGRSQKVEIVDANNVVLDSRTVSKFGGGQYLVWNLSGRVSIRFTNMNPYSNAVLSGIFFRPLSISLSWTASTSLNVTGYNLYRATTTGGPYTKLTPSPVASLTYLDSGVSPGQAYYYVATAVDSSGDESVYSTEAAAMVPAS